MIAVLIAVLFVAVVVLVAAWTLHRDMRAVQRVLKAEQQRREEIRRQIEGKLEPARRHLRTVR